MDGRTQNQEVVIMLLRDNGGKVICPFVVSRAQDFQMEEKDENEDGYFGDQP